MRPIYDRYTMDDDGRIDGIPRDIGGIGIDAMAVGAFDHSPIQNGGGRKISIID